MAENIYSANIKKRFPLLIRCIDPSEQLLTEFSFTECPKEKIDWIESASTDSVKNTRLLKTLLDSTTEVVDKFIELLQCYEQSHVANVLLGNEDTNIWPMSEEHLQMLRDKKDELCDYLDPGKNLLTFLESQKALTSPDVDRIRSKLKNGSREMSYELLRILERKPNAAFDSLIVGLYKTRQSHVVYILNGHGEPPIETYNIRLLDTHRCELADKLEPIHSNLVDELLSQELISEDEYQVVKEIKSRYEQGIYLVDAFKRKSSNAFKCFVEALKKTGQGHLAKLFPCISGTVQLCGSFCSGKLSELERSVVKEIQGSEVLPSMRSDGIYSKVEKGSIKIQFSCMSAESRTKLRHLYESGTLDRLLYENHGRKFSKQGLQSLKVHIPPSEFEDVESCTMMTSKHHSVLQSAADKFASQVTVSEELLAKLSLCGRRRQAILSQTTAEERSRLLFDIVSRQPDSAFEQLVGALRDTGYGNRKVAGFLQNQCQQPCSPGSRSTMSKGTCQGNEVHPTATVDDMEKYRRDGMHSLCIGMHSFFNSIDVRN